MKKESHFNCDLTVNILDVGALAPAHKPQLAGAAPQRAILALRVRRGCVPFELCSTTPIRSLQL